MLTVYFPVHQIFTFHPNSVYNMKTPVDSVFFSDLVLQCLDYAPYLPESDAKFVKNVRSLRLAVNVFRCDYYSYFLRLISKIPKPNWLDERNFFEHICCINLKDKDEEFLLTCSVVVQYVHFVFMESACHYAFYIAVRSLDRIFQYKYLGIFGDIGGWREFERFCDMTVVKRRGSFRASFNAESDALHYTSGKSDILNFWDEHEIIEIVGDADEQEGWHDGVFDVTMVASKQRPRSDYELYLKQRLDINQLEISTTFSEDLELVILQEIAYGCRKEAGKFCFGCVLTHSWQETTKQWHTGARDNENPKVLQEELKTLEMENGTKIYESENLDTVDILNNGLEEESNFFLKIIKKNFRCGINTLKYLLLRFTPFENIFASIMKVFRFIMDTFGRFFDFKKHGDAPTLDPAPDNPELECDLAENSTQTEPKSTGGIILRVEAESSGNDFSENSSPSKPKSTVNINPCVEAESSGNALPVESMPDEILSLGECESVVRQKNEFSGNIPLSLEEYIYPTLLKYDLVFSEIVLNQVQKALEWTHGTLIFKKLKSEDSEILNSIKCPFCKMFCWKAVNGETVEYKMVFEDQF